MRSIVTGLAAASLIVGMASAQTTTTAPGAAPTTGTTTGTAPAPVIGSTTRPMTGTTTGTTMGATQGTGVAPMGTATTGLTPVRPMTGASGVAAASGDNNQAVATTAANAPSPAKGRNSYTANQARNRIQARGYAQVADLKKDSNGVWRGKGMKDGASMDVWLDYKGNVGQQ